MTRHREAASEFIAFGSLEGYLNQDELALELEIRLEEMFQSLDFVACALSLIELGSPYYQLHPRVALPQ